MDNLTHTLIGVLVGETLSRTLPAAEGGLSAQQRRGLLIGVMAVGGNFPDLDFLHSAIAGGKLDYLLQHRGHTHTVIGAVLIAGVLFLACHAWLRWRRLSLSCSDRRALFGVALLAPLLHIVMDFGNNYGVHPFWPFYNGWLYGDSIFIVEPLFWAACAPLVFLLKTRVARGIVALALAAGIGLSIFTGMVPAPLVILLTVLTLIMLAVGRYAPPRAALFTGIGVWLGVTALFAVAGRVAAGQVEAAARQSGAGTLLDHVLTPMPVNPVCWDVLLVQSAGEQYSLRQALVSLAPGWIPAVRCPLRGLNTETTAPLTPIRDASTDALQWRGEIVLSRSQLKDLAAHSCQATALLQFARAPFFTQQKGEGEGKWIVGDLRYDREPDAGFAETELNKDRCPVFSAPWTPPRAADLLR